jgi:hypothetical protein
MKKLDINSYLNMVDENYSGYYGDATPYGNMDLDFSGADGDARMAAPRAVSPTPYQISVANTTAGTLTVVLFGLNQYLLSTNFGSAVGLTVTPSQSNITYIMLLQQSAAQPFETSLIRVQSSNAAQVTQILTVQSTDANGQTCTVPVITQSYFSANQFQSGIVDVPYAVTIDGNTNITSQVLANTTVIYTFFPAEKVNAARALRGRSESPLKMYAAPSVPIITNQIPSSYPQLR